MIFNIFNTHLWQNTVNPIPIHNETLFCIPIDNPSKTAWIPIAIYNIYGVKVFKLFTFSSDSMC
jgi:hypothetical protein